MLLSFFEKRTLAKNAQAKRNQTSLDKHCKLPLKPKHKAMIWPAGGWGVTFFRLQVYGRVGISQVEV